MIRILEIDNSKGWGGQEIRTQRLINGLNKEEFEVFFAVQPDSGYMEKKDEIKAQMLPLTIRKGYDVFAFLKLCYYVVKYDIDIISTHSGWDGWLGALCGKLLRKKVIRTRHLQTPITNATSYNLSDRIVTDSKFVKNSLKQQGVNEKKIVTIYTGVNLKEYSHEKRGRLRLELELGKDVVVIGMVAVFRYAKRHDLLVEAIYRLLQMYPHLNLKLVFIGDGPQKKIVEDLVKNFSLEERVVFLGHREDVSLLLPDLDIAVLPSMMEALGTSILEASASGVCVVGSSAGGIPEAVIHEKTGLVFQSENVEDLMEKLKDLIFDPEKRQMYGIQGREHVHEIFSLEKMVKETQKLYRNILK